MSVPKEKYCPTCRTVKPITEFTPRNKEHTKFKYQCKPCYNAYHRRWTYTQRVLRELGASNG